jgi:hypothetical protein
MVKNIPKGLEADYKKELDFVFRHTAVPGRELQVRKIVLVYDIDYLIELE